MTAPAATHGRRGRWRTPNLLARRSLTLLTSSRGQTMHQARPSKTATQIIVGHHTPQMSNVTRLVLANSFGFAPGGAYTPQDSTAKAMNTASIAACTTYGKPPQRTNARTPGNRSKLKPSGGVAAATGAECRPHARAPPAAIAPAGVSVRVPFVGRAFTKALSQS